MKIPYSAEQVEGDAAPVRRDRFPNRRDADERGAHRGRIVQDNRHQGHQLRNQASYRDH